MTAGTYYVRFAEDKNHNASKGVEVVIAEGTATKVTVTFDAQDETIKIDPITVNEGETVKLPNAPEKFGSEFKGWFTDKGTYKIEFTEETKVTESITVYAQWKPLTEMTVKTADELTKALALDGVTKVTLEGNVALTETLEIPADKTLTVTGTLDASAAGIAVVNKGTLVGTGAIKLSADGKHEGVAITNAEFFCVNDKASHDKLLDAGEAAWDDATFATLPWVVVLYNRACKDATVTLTASKDSATVTETLENAKDNQKAYITVNAAENKGLDVGTYAVELKIAEADGLTVTMEATVEVAAAEKYTPEA